MKFKYQPKKGLRSRNIFCGFYGKCLNLAIKNSWVRWHCNDCRHCDNYEAAPEMMLTSNHPVAYYEMVHQIGAGLL